MCWEGYNSGSSNYQEREEGGIAVSLFPEMQRGPCLWILQVEGDSYIKTLFHVNITLYLGPNWPLDDNNMFIYIVHPTWHGTAALESFNETMKTLALKPSVSWNSNVFTALLKASRLSSVRMCRGRAFHRRGALYAKVRLPYVVFRKQVFSFKKSSGRQLYGLNSSWILLGLVPWMLL